MIYLVLGAGLLMLLLAISASGGTFGGNTAMGLPGSVGGYRFEWSSAAPVNLLDMVRGAARAVGLAPAYLLTVVYIESRGNPKAVNPSDPSYGIAQMVMPTACFYDQEGMVKDYDSLLADPGLALRLAARFLADLEAKYAARFAFGEWVQAYNVGESKYNRGVRNWSYGGKVRDSAGNLVSFGAGDLERLLAGAV